MLVKVLTCGGKPKAEKEISGSTDGQSTSQAAQDESASSEESEPEGTLECWDNFMMNRESDID